MARSKYTLFSAISGTIGTVAAAIAIYDFVLPKVQFAPPAPVVQEKQKITKPNETQVAIIKETPIEKPVVSNQDTRQHAQNVDAKTEPPQTSTDVDPPKKVKPACDGSDWTNYSEPIPVKVGMKVCDKTGRLIAKVTSIVTEGYFGGAISFEAPGKPQPLKCYRLKPCQFPWARGATFVIESFEGDFGETVAMLIAQ